MTKLIVAILVAVLSTLVTIWVMVSGWGLDAKSWGVIIWGAVIQLALVMMLQLSVSEK